VAAGPDIPDWVDPRDLDADIRGALRSLEARNAQRVAAHLVAAGTLVDEDPTVALAHARAARDRASRIAAVREAVGVAAYHAGDYAEAARELRAYRRMSGDEGYRAVLADCERALGRPEVALRLVREALDAGAEPEEVIELHLVEAGARAELGELPAALLVLEGALGGRRRLEDLDLADESVLRLSTAYADLLEQAGRPEADQWQSAVAAAQPEDEDVVFGEEELPEELLSAAGSEADDQGDEELHLSSVEDVADEEDELLDLPGVSEADIEAEVAELLGETDGASEPDDDGAEETAPGE
jgi:tetratricopeptide (TPR) repeat protein